MRVTLATTNALRYGDDLLSKSAASLKRIAKRKSLPVTLEHDGPKVGQATNLMYEVRSGVGYLTGLISDLCGMSGTSLQYTGERVGDRINISKVDHVALVRTPRDPIALFSDSTDAPCIRYQDSADATDEATDNDTDTNTEGAAPVEEINREGELQVELTDDVIEKIYESIFSNPDRLNNLVDRLQEHVNSLEPETEPTEPDTNPTPQPNQSEPKPLRRVIIKPRIAQETVPPKTPKPIQRPFKGLL